MKNLHEKAMKEDENGAAPIISYFNRSKSDLPPVDLLPLNEQGDDKPLAVIKYNYFKLLVRWLFFYGPGTGVFILPFMRPSSGWVWLILSSAMIFLMFIICLVRPVNMKSVSIYNRYIRQRYRILGKDKIIAIDKAYYSSEDRWLREYTGISEINKSQKEKKKLFLMGLEEIQFSQGFVGNASLNKFYSVLGQMTSRNPEEFCHMAGKLMK